MGKKAVNQETQKAPIAMVDATPPMVVPQGSWGGEEMENSDVLIPKLLLMQGLSQLVADGKASVGQVRDSLSGEQMGGWDGQKKTAVPVEMIIFHSFKSWIIFEQVGEKYEFVSQEPMTPDNQGWLLEEVVNGKKIRRDKTLNFYVVRPSDIKDGMAFPYLLSCRRTSYKAGRKLATCFAKLKAFNKPTASKVFNLVVAQQENDKGKYFVFDVTQGRDSTLAELGEAFKWNQTLKNVKVKEDHRDLKTENVASAPVGEDANQDY